MSVAETDRKYTQSQYVNTEKATKKNGLPESAFTSNEFVLTKEASDKGIYSPYEENQEKVPPAIFDNASEATSTLLKELEKLSENHTRPSQAKWSVKENTQTTQQDPAIIHAAAHSTDNFMKAQSNADL